MSKVLIIEDEVSIAELEKDYLELSGFDVEIAVSLHVGVGDRRRFVAADHIAEPSAVDQPVALLLHPDVGAHQVVLDFRLNQQA